MSLLRLMSLMSDKIDKISWQNLCTSFIPCKLKLLILTCLSKSIFDVHKLNSQNIHAVTMTLILVKSPFSRRGNFFVLSNRLHFVKFKHVISELAFYKIKFSY